MIMTSLEDLIIVNSLTLGIKIPQSITSLLRLDYSEDDIVLIKFFILHYFRFYQIDSNTQQ